MGGGEDIAAYLWDQFACEDARELVLEVAAEHLADRDRAEAAR
jgi:hypothetical protein